MIAVVAMVAVVAMIDVVAMIAVYRRRLQKCFRIHHVFNVSAFLSRQDLADARVMLCVTAVTAQVLHQHHQFAITKIPNRVRMI